MQKIVNELITSSIKGVDVYRWKSATWLIFTDETRWVVELTDEGTLWYNYRFFKDVLKYASIECGKESEGYIIEWANNFFYKDCAHRTVPYPTDTARYETPNVLENGIKNVIRTRDTGEDYIKKVVDGGINETQQRGKDHGNEFEWYTRAVIGQGIKEVNQSDSIHRQRRAENEMSRMIKEVKPNRVTVHDEKMDRFYYDPSCTANFTILTDIVEEGVKNIYPDTIPGEYDWRKEFDTVRVIDNGIRVIPLPTIKDLRGYTDYYNTKEDRTKPHTEYVKDVIEGGVKL